jgi:hypothetical protein
VIITGYMVYIICIVYPVYFIYIICIIYTVHTICRGYIPCTAAGKRYHAAVFAILRGFLYLDKEIYANAGKTAIRGAQKPTRANKKVLTGEE